MRDQEEADARPYEDYLAGRSETELAAVEAEYRKFSGLNQEFDGGDSGGGVVGDGNTDLEDQHNSATLGALRGGVSDLTSTGQDIGRGRVARPKGATEARTASAGKNYFGRSTGLADELIQKGFSGYDVKNKRMDRVRAQQKENWFNQRAIHAINRAQGQGVVFGEEKKIMPKDGGFIAREAIASDAWRSGGVKEEISQRDLAKHMDKLASTPAKRLDGEEWEELVVADADTIEETYEVRASTRQTSVTSILVRNDFNTFAPFLCDFVSGSSDAFTVTPNHGTMNRRAGEPLDLTVRYTPQDACSVAEATLVLQTEDMKKVYKFIGST
jgi:hypothetical protein